MSNVNALALGEHRAWQRELASEYVTHSHETFDEVVRRLERERPESPHQRQLRQNREKNND